MLVLKMVKQPIQHAEYMRNSAQVELLMLNQGKLWKEVDSQDLYIHQFSLSLSLSCYFLERTILTLIKHTGTQRCYQFQGVPVSETSEGKLDEKLLRGLFIHGP